jgi:hypothetical protein
LLKVDFAAAQQAVRLPPAVPEAAAAAKRPAGKAAARRG